MRFMKHSIIGIALLAAIPAAAWSAPLSVEVTSDRGPDAVYQDNEVLDLSVRVSEDAHVLVYEIDSEGTVQVIYPGPGVIGFLEGGRTYRLADQFPDLELAIQGPVGQGYIVAIASREAFQDLPWYLRPPNTQAEQLGYEGQNVEEEGVTTEGRVVGDPFVAMERIRRRVVKDNQDPDAFGTSYLSYYVHEQVAYPRYLCEDCHRPGHWTWYEGYDPYYTTCSAVNVRVNWGWAWGPSYWFGYVPYYVYAPAYYPYAYTVPPAGWWCSWNGWSNWCATWPQTVRYKAALPAGYVAPADYQKKYRRGEVGPPPGYLTRTTPTGGGARTRDVAVGRNRAPVTDTPVGSRVTGRSRPTDNGTRDLVSRNGTTPAKREFGAWRRVDSGTGRLGRAVNDGGARGARTRDAGTRESGTDLRNMGQSRSPAGRWRTRLEAGGGGQSMGRGVARGRTVSSLESRSTSGSNAGSRNAPAPRTVTNEIPSWTRTGGRNSAPAGEVYRNTPGYNPANPQNLTRGMDGMRQLWSGGSSGPMPSGRSAPSGGGGRASTGPSGGRTSR